MRSNAAYSKSKVSPARAAAFDILMRVEREAAYASELLHSPAYERLPPTDHGLAMELVMGVLRWRSVIDEQVANSSERSLAKIDLEALTAIRIGAYQIGWLNRIPTHAAVDESVEMTKRARKKSAAAFVNAVLRKLVAQSRLTHKRSIDPSALAFRASPSWLTDRWAETYGSEAAHEICLYNQSVPRTAIRFSGCSGVSAPAIERRLLDEGIELAPGALLPSARRVVRGDIAHTAVYREGLCSIQDESSQLVAALVGRGKRILDCCAAPGGKTRVIAEHNLQSQILAVDLHEHRARLLQRLLSLDSSGRRETSGLRTIAADARYLPLAGGFDRVLADVPCSGTGTLARNPEIKWRLWPKDLTDLQSRQMAILRSALDQVEGRGRLVYSTCSLEKEENEEVVQTILQENASCRLLDCRSELEKLRTEGHLIWRDLSSLARGPYLRTIPGIHPCDGFFAAIFEKSLAG